MRLFKKFICWLSVAIVSVSLFNTILYYTWGDFKIAVDTNILNKEEVVDTSEKDGEIAFLTSQVEEKESVIVIIQSELLGEKAKVERLEAEALTNAETIAEFQEIIEAKTKEIEALELEKNSLSAEIAELDAEISENENQITALQNSNSELIAQKEELEADLLANNTTIAELNAQIEINNITISELETDNIAKASEIENLNTTISEKEIEIEALNEQVSTLVTERDNALARLAETQTELETAQAELNTLSEQLEVYQNELNSDIAKMYVAEFLTDGSVISCQIDETYYLMASLDRGDGVYKFNSINYELERVYTTKIETFIKLSNGDIFCRAVSSNNVIIYDCSTDSFVNNSTAKNGKCYEFNCGKALFVSGDSTGGTGFLYDLETATFEEFPDCIIDWKDSYTGFVQTGSSTGIFYKLATAGTISYIDVLAKTYKTISEISTESVYCFGGIELESGNLLLSLSDGLYNLNVTTWEFTKIYDTTNTYKNFKKLKDGNIYIGGYNSSSFKIYNETEGIIFEGTYGQNSSVAEMSDGNLVLMSGAGGIALLKLEDYSVTILSSKGLWTCTKILSNGNALFTCTKAVSSSYGYGIVLYKTESQELINLIGTTSTYGYNYDIVYELLDDKVLIGTSTNSAVKRIYLYNKTDNSCTKLALSYLLTNVSVSDENGLTIRARSSLTGSFVKLYYDYSKGELSVITEETTAL